MFKDELILANFISNLFYSIAYPAVHFTLIKDVGEKMIALNSIVICLDGVVFPMLWNKCPKLYKSYGYLLSAEGLTYTLIGVLVCLGLISNTLYYVLDTILFSLISKNIICGGNKLRAIRYNNETAREHYDNGSALVANFSSLLGFGVSYVVTLPNSVAFILITIGICIDNVFYYKAYKDSLLKV